MTVVIRRLTPEISKGRCLFFEFLKSYACCGTSIGQPPLRIPGLVEGEIAAIDAGDCKPAAVFHRDKNECISHPAAGIFREWRLSKMKAIGYALGDVSYRSARLENEQPKAHPLRPFPSLGAGVRVSVSPYAR
jgi:hypothetical protein